MGERLAAEIDAFIMDNCRKSLGRISFVAHSLGGIIVRTALAHDLMKPYLGKLYTMVWPTCLLLHVLLEDSLVRTGEFGNPALRLPVQQ